MLLADLLGRLLGAPVRFLQLRLALLELGDVGVDRDRAAAGDLALGDQDPAAVGAMLQGRRAGIAMLRQALPNVPLGVVARLVDQPALDRAPEDRLERGPGLDLDVAAGIEQLPVARVAQLEPVLGIVEGEALGDALDGVDQALAGVLDLAQALVLDLDRGVAEHGQRPRHLGDLVLAAGRWQRHAQVAAGDRQHAAAERGRAASADRAARRARRSGPS